MSAISIQLGAPVSDVGAAYASETFRLIHGYNRRFTFYGITIMHLMLGLTVAHRYNTAVCGKSFTQQGDACNQLPGHDGDCCYRGPDYRT